MPRATVHRASLPQARRADGTNPKMCKFLVVDHASRAGSERNSRTVTTLLSSSAPSQRRAPRVATDAPGERVDDVGQAR